MSTEWSQPDSSEEAFPGKHGNEHRAPEHLQTHIISTSSDMHGAVHLMTGQIMQLQKKCRFGILLAYLALQMLQNLPQ